MTKNELNIGDKIIIKGDFTDFTDHLDGATLTISHLNETDNGDPLDDDTILACEENGTEWYIYIKNIVEVI